MVWLPSTSAALTCWGPRAGQAPSTHLVAMATIFKCSVPRAGAGLRAARVGRVGCNVRANAAATVQEARKLLVTQGWERAWIDGVTERISRKQIACSTQDMQDVVRPPPLTCCLAPLSCQVT